MVGILWGTGVGLRDNNDESITSSFKRNSYNLELTHEIINSESTETLVREPQDIPLNLHKMVFWNVSRSLHKEKFTRRLPANRTYYCLESKSTKLQILQTLSRWESFCLMFLRENQE